MSNSTIYNGEKPQGSQTYFSGYARPEKRLEIYPIPPPDTPELIMSPELLHSKMFTNTEAKEIIEESIEKYKEENDHD